MYAPNNDSAKDNNGLTGSIVNAAKFAFTSPFQIHFRDGEIFSSEQVLRLVPKKRMIAFGTWQNKPVVAKLFFNQRHAKTNMEKDLAGVRLLQYKQILTPNLLYQGISEDEQIYVLLFERIFDAHTLEEIWKNKKSEDSLQPLMQSMMFEFAAKHRLGILQHDLHLNNYLLTPTEIYMLDGEKIEFSDYLSKEICINNLAEFFSQFGVEMEAYQEDLFCYYAMMRGWLLKQSDIKQLSTLVQKWNVRRWERCKKKITEESSNFSLVNQSGVSGVIDRSHGYPNFINLIHNPDDIFNHPDAEIINESGEIKEIKLKIDNCDIVAKRYSQNFWQSLTQCFSHSKAFKIWQIAQKLNFSGIKTAKPIAFFEKRSFGFCIKSYYFTEAVAGVSLTEFLANKAQSNHVAKHVADLFKDLPKLGFKNDSLTLQTVMINHQEQPVITNLESITILSSQLKSQLSYFLRIYCSFNLRSRILKLTSRARFNENH